MLSLLPEAWSEWENQNLQGNFLLQMLHLQCKELLRCKRESIPGNQAYSCKSRDPPFRDNTCSVLPLRKMVVLANGSTFFQRARLVLSYRVTREGYVCGTDRVASPHISGWLRWNLEGLTRPPWVSVTISAYAWSWRGRNDDQER